MTVLAWLLLCVTVIQLGQGNHSIPTEDGMATVSRSTVIPSLDYEMTNTSDQSQMRRSRRSVADAERAYADAEQALKDASAATTRNATEVDAAKEAKRLADEALAAANGEKAREDERLRKAQEADADAAQLVVDTKARKEASEAAYITARDEHKAKNDGLDTLKKVTIPDLKVKSESANATRDGLKEKWDTAKTDAKDFSEWLKEYNDLITDKTNNDNKIADYAKNSGYSDAMNAAIKEKTDNKLQDKFNTANANLKMAQKEKTEIESNVILNGNTADLDKKTIKELVKQRSEAVTNAQLAYDAGKADAVKGPQLKAKLTTAQNELDSIKQLEKFHKSKPVKDIRIMFNDILRDSNEYKQNELVNGVNTENFLKKTVKEVITQKQSEVAKAKTDLKPENTDEKINEKKKSIEGAEKEIGFLNEMDTMYTSSSVDDAKKDFAKKKAAADTNLKIWIKNDILNGKNKDDFGQETIEKAVTRIKAAYGTAEANHNNEPDPAKKATLKPIFDKAKELFTFIQDLEKAPFEKTMLVKDAQKMKTDADKVVEIYSKNEILNGKMRDTYGKFAVTQLLTQKNSAVGTAKAEYANVLALKAKVGKCEKELTWIMQLKKLGENSAVEQLKSNYKNGGEAAADAVISRSKSNDMLNGKNKKFDDKILTEAMEEQKGIVDAAKEAHLQAIGKPNEQQLYNIHQQAEIDHYFLEEMLNYDNTLIEELKNNLAKLKSSANQAVTKAQGEFNSADTELKRVVKIIDDNKAKLVGVDLNDQKSKSIEARIELHTKVNPGLLDYKGKLEAKAVKCGYPTDENEWANDEVQLKADIKTQKDLYDAAEEKANEAAKTFHKAEKSLVNQKSAIEAKEGAARTAASNAETRDVQAHNDAVSDRPKAATALANAETANKAAAEKLGPLVKAASDAAADLQNKNNILLVALQDEKKATQKRDDAKTEQAAAIKQEQEYKQQIRVLASGFGITGGIVLIAVGAGLAFFLVRRRKKKQKKVQEKKEPSREELPADNGLTIIRREGMADKYVVKGEDFIIRGPLVRSRVHNAVPTKHLLEDQEGGDKIEKIFFDKNLNEAFFIGEGVEIMEEDSVSRTEDRPPTDHKGRNVLELFGEFGDPEHPEKYAEAEKKFLAEVEEKKKAKALAKAAAGGIPDAKKSSKSKRAAPPAQIAPSSSSDDQDKKKASTPMSGEGLKK